MSGTGPRASNRAARSLGLTSRGTGVLLLAAGTVALSILSPLAELRAVALTLVLGLLAAGVAALPVRRRHLGLTASTPRTPTGTGTVLTLSARHPGRRMLPAVTLQLPETGEEAGPVAVTLPAMPPGAEHRQRIPITPGRRAVRMLGPLREIREDPLGLWRRTVHHGSAATVTVAPRSVRLTGVPVAEVHARLHPPLIGSEHAQELALAVLHSLALRTAVSGAPLRVHLEGRARAVRSLAELQDELARWTWSPADIPAAPPARTGTSARILVTGSGAGPRVLAAWSGPSADARLVIRCAGTGSTRRTAVAGLPVVDLARLEDLPRALDPVGAASRDLARTPTATTPDAEVTA